eukprot:1736995-Amphidinium_carterae.1
MTIEIFVQAQKKYDPMNPPTHNRFFVFLLQHYRERLQNIFLRAGATIEDYNEAVDYFDRRGGAHFNRPNRRDLQEIYLYKLRKLLKNENGLYIAYENYQTCRHDARHHPSHKKEKYQTRTMRRDQRREHQ